MLPAINQTIRIRLPGKYLSKLLEVKNIIDTFVSLKIRIISHFKNTHRNHGKQRTVRNGKK